MKMKEFCLETDANLFVEIFNNCTKYAPYSIPLDTGKLTNHVVKNVDNLNEFVYIYNFNDKKGIVHFGLNPGNKREGLIYLLLSNTNHAAGELLQQAEEKLLQMGVSFIRCFPWQPNPYKGILYGVEAYCWAGLYTTNNAFRRLSYDIGLDIVVMSLRMDKRPQIEDLDDNALAIEEVSVRDDELFTHGQFIAYCNGRQVGRSGYYHLKALSVNLKKGYGQIDIWIHDEYHGKNLGMHLMQSVHQRLYDRNVRNVILATNQSFFRAIKFYEKLGYKAEPIRAYSYRKEL